MKKMFALRSKATLSLKSLSIKGLDLKIEIGRISHSLEGLPGCLVECEKNVSCSIVWSTMYYLYNIIITKLLYLTPLNFNIYIHIYIHSDHCFIRTSLISFYYKDVCLSEACWHTCLKYCDTLQHPLFR